MCLVNQRPSLFLFHEVGRTETLPCEAMGEDPGPQLFPTKKHELIFFWGEGQKIDNFGPYTVKIYEFTAHTTLEINDKKIRMAPVATVS